MIAGKDYEKFAIFIAFLFAYKCSRWHLVTIGIIPPKRPFAYTQISSHIDGHQKLGATIKFGAFSDVNIFFFPIYSALWIKNITLWNLQPFSHCTIGFAHQKIRRTSASTAKEIEKLQSSTSVDSGSSSPRSMFPSLMERTFLPQIVSQVWLLC